MADAEECINHAAEVARQATHFDLSGSHEAAIYMYHQAAQYLHRAAALGVSSPAIAERIQQYRNRADVLESNGKNFIILLFEINIDSSTYFHNQIKYCSTVYNLI